MTPAEPEFMKLKLISDGLKINTFIIDEATGKVLDNITSIKFEVNGRDGLVLVDVQFECMSFEISANAKMHLQASADKLLEKMKTKATCDPILDEAQGPML